jgi:hypothetical protein
MQRIKKLLGKNEDDLLTDLEMYADFTTVHHGDFVEILGTGRDDMTIKDIKVSYNHYYVFISGVAAMDSMSYHIRRFKTKIPMPKDAKKKDICAQFVKDGKAMRVIVPIKQRKRMAGKLLYSNGEESLIYSSA